MDRRDRTRCSRPSCRTPRARRSLAVLIAVSMNPLGMLLARARGIWDFGPGGNVILMHYPDYLLVGVAVVISHVVTKLGQQVTRARELGSYELGELLGRGGMGEVYRATHRMLARPAAIKLIRPEMLSGDDGRRAARRAALPPRGRGGGQPALAAHGGALRLRRDRRRHALLRDGAAGRARPRVARAPARAAAGEPRDPHPAPGLRLARRGARPRASCIATSSRRTSTSAASGCRTTS